MLLLVTTKFYKFATQSPLRVVMFLLALGSNTEVMFEAQRAWIVVFVGH